MKISERDQRYSERWPAAPEPDRLVEHPAPWRARVAIAFLAAVPWLMFFALVFTAAWLVMFDADAGNDGLGWGILALSLPCLFAATAVSRWQQRRVRARYELELAIHRPADRGGLLDWLDPF